MNIANDRAPETDVIAALRKATASRHHALDSTLAIGAPGASLADYVHHLELLRRWLGPLEAWLHGYADGPHRVPGLEPPCRLALIDSDLLDAGCGVPADAADAAWPADAGLAYRWGVSYVIEGSQLGGAVLYAQLAGPLAPHPLRYLRGDPAGPGPRWRAFMLALRSQVRTPQEIADACAGACAAFDLILALRSLKRA
ncbi:MAG TPA: biliverdin-producing heme oxygenase [Telluria sp.]